MFSATLQQSLYLLHIILSVMSETLIYLKLVHNMQGNALMCFCKVGKTEFIPNLRHQPVR